MQLKGPGDTVLCKNLPHAGPCIPLTSDEETPQCGLVLEDLLKAHALALLLLPLERVDDLFEHSYRDRVSQVAVRVGLRDNDPRLFEQILSGQPSRGFWDERDDDYADDREDALEEGGRAPRPGGLPATCAQSAASRQSMKVAGYANSYTYIPAAISAPI